MMSVSTPKERRVIEQVFRHPYTLSIHQLRAPGRGDDRISFAGSFQENSYYTQHAELGFGRDQPEAPEILSEIGYCEVYLKQELPSAQRRWIDQHIGQEVEVTILTSGREQIAYLGRILSHQLIVVTVPSRPAAKEVKKDGEKGLQLFYEGLGLPPPELTEPDGIPSGISEEGS